MARYGGNTPCIEVIASSSSGGVGGGGRGSGCGCDDDGNGGGGGGHRIIFDMGSGAFDLGQKILVEMSQHRRRMADMEEKGERDEGGVGARGGELSTSEKKQHRSNRFGGSILITHTHWDHIQGNYY
jgi:phosphoribosyl 1,2-cyclic phosphodiesterase